VKIVPINKSTKTDDQRNNASQKEEEQATQPEKMARTPASLNGIDKK